MPQRHPKYGANRPNRHCEAGHSRPRQSHSRKHVRFLFISPGFTLLEVLIALAILGVGLIAVMQLFPLALTQARRAAERTITAQITQSKLSQQRTAGAENLYAGNIDAALLNNTRDLRTRQRIDDIVAARFADPNHPLRLTPAQRAAIVAKIGDTVPDPDVVGSIQTFQNELALTQVFVGFNATTQRLPGASESHLQRTTFTIEFADERFETLVTYTAKQ